MTTFTLKRGISRGTINNDIGVGVGVVERDVDKIIKELGFDKTKPMVLSGDDQEDLDAKGDYFKDWYLEELQNFYDEK